MRVLVIGGRGTVWMAANIAWMDRYGLVGNSEADPLEDRIIAELRRLPERVVAGSPARSSA